MVDSFSGYDLIAAASPVYPNDINNEFNGILFWHRNRSSRASVGWVYRIISRPRGQLVIGTTPEAYKPLEVLS